MAKIRNNGTIISTDYNFAKLIDGSITEIVIPKSVKNIRSYAFYNYDNLKQIKIPYGVETIGTHTFYSCEGLTSVEIPDSVISIGYRAFETCSNLNSVTLSKNMTELSSFLFFNNTNLIQIELPEKTRSIGESCFYNCSSLQEIKLNEGLVSLGRTAFQNCTSMQRVIIPKTFRTFDVQVFYNCTNMKYVFFMGDNPINYSNSLGIFWNCNNIRLYDMRNMQSAKDKASGQTFTANNVYLYINVPDSLYNEFTALPNWSALNLKRWVHSCDVSTFEEIENPIDGDYYSLKGDTNYLNPLGEKQIDVRQYVNGAWVEIDIG